MGVMSSVRPNGPRRTALFIVLNGVSVVANDSATAFISVGVEDGTSYRSQCLQLNQRLNPEGTGKQQSRIQKLI